MHILKSINEYIGRYISWLIIIMVIVQIVTVLSRYVFGLGFIKLQELMIYMHGTLFTVAAGYTLLYDEHVRVDSFYRESSKKFKNVVNLIGTLTLLMPFIIVTFFMSYPYVIRSWKILYQFTSAFKCKKTEPNPIAALSISTNSLGGFTPFKRRSSLCTFWTTSRP